MCKDCIYCMYRKKRFFFLHGKVQKSTGRNQQVTVTEGISISTVDKKNGIG
jgi:hypothetical protein